MIIDKKISLKAVILGTSVCAILTNFAPKAVQAVDFKGSLQVGGTLPYRSEFIVRTGVSAFDPNETPVDFVRGIGDYKIKLLSTEVYKAKQNQKFDLMSLKYRNSTTSLPEGLAQSFLDHFLNFSGPYYEYGFFIDGYQNISLNTNQPPFDKNDGTIKFYLPSKFIYSDLGKSFSIDFSSNPTANLLQSLKGLKTILTTANNVGLATFRIPSNIPLTNSNTLVKNTDTLKRVDVVFETTPIPESNFNAGIIILGIIGSLAIFRQQCSM